MAIFEEEEEEQTVKLKRLKSDVLLKWCKRMAIYKKGEETWTNRVWPRCDYGEIC